MEESINDVDDLGTFSRDNDNSNVFQCPASTMEGHVRYVDWIGKNPRVSFAAETLHTTNSPIKRTVTDWPPLKSILKNNRKKIEELAANYSTPTYVKVIKIEPRHKITISVSDRYYSAASNTNQHVFTILIDQLLYKLIWIVSQFSADFLFNKNDGWKTDNDAIISQGNSLNPHSLQQLIIQWEVIKCWLIMRAIIVWPTKPKFGQNCTLKMQTFWQKEWLLNTFFT